MHVTYTVQAVAGSLSSIPSDPFSFDTPRCVSQVTLNVTFDSLTILNVNDTGDCCFFCGADRVLEVGPESWIGVRTSDEIYVKRLLAAPTVNNMYTYLDLAEGNYSWNRFYLTDKTNGFFLPPYYAGSSGSSFPVTLTAAGPVALHVLLEDHDTCRVVPDRIDTFCYAVYTFPSRSLSDWAGYRDTITMSSGTSEGSCRITATVEGFGR
jgi:hypothetical protein